ncbi:hypothetical protein SDC9_176414 [bioreactor metagenome]|uniref:Uncharacterized protein n=1 Tax=bioreactor metagenome TaxID=1076179 RepID=A0A645GQ09_9ZZZZ
MMERAYNTKAGVEQKQDVLPEFLRNEKTQGTQTIFDVEQEEMNLMWVPEEYRAIHGFEIATKLFAGKGKLIITSIGYISDKSIYGAIKENGIEVHIIGDSNKVFNLLGTI